MTPAELLDAARRLQDGAAAPAASAAGCWHRASAFLTRMALEQAVTDRVLARYPTAHRASMASKLQCLRTVSPEAAAVAIAAWHQLSRACHPHPYELAPTAAELRRWTDAVARLL